jgi:hypothetical protein
MRDDKTCTVRLEFDVQDCATAHLADQGWDQYPEEPVRSVGNIQVAKHSVSLWTTHQWGQTNFTVTIADRDPGADLTGYEEIAEISYASASGQVALVGFNYDNLPMSPLPPLPAGPGTYRIRYHVKGMDTEGTGDATDDHYLQIWPSPLEEPAVIKATPEAL